MQPKKELGLAVSHLAASDSSVLPIPAYWPGSSKEHLSVPAAFRTPSVGSLVNESNIETIFPLGMSENLGCVIVK